MRQQDTELTDEEKQFISGDGKLNSFGPTCSLRDEIAMRALTGILSNNFVKEKDMINIADEAYKWADAMIAARQKMD